MTNDHVIATRTTALLLAGLVAACTGADESPTTDTLSAELDSTGAVLTQHNDIARTGLNPNETTLTWANVPGGFGKLFTIPLAGRVFAQPLYAPAVSTASGVRDLVVVATEANNVYAFDAHDGTQIWTVNLGVPIPSADAYRSECTNIPDTIGITGTPVIDPSTGTLYLVAATKLTATKWRQTLHALDVATGVARVTGHPIAAQLSGDGFDILFFDPLRENQRAGLLLKDGRVYVAWSGHCDDFLDSPNPQVFFGWLMSFDAASLAPVSVFNAARHKDPGNPVEPYGGSIWLGAGGIPADDGKLYVTTGNALFDPTNGDYGDSVLALNPALGLASSFTPADESTLNANDLDFSSGGVVLVPETAPFHPRLLVTAGKEGWIYLLDRDALGGAQSGVDRICSTTAADTDCVVAKSAQQLGTQDGNWYFGIPAYWNGHLYFAGNGDTLKRFDLGGTPFLSGIIARTTTAFGYPGTTPSISANGNADAIVWALERTQPGPFTFPDPTHLHAYRADSLAELYNSGAGVPRTTSGPDDPSNASQFLTPTVAAGRVFVGTKDSLAIYGLHLSVTTVTQSVTQGAAATYVVSTAFASPATTTTLSVTTALPAGVTATFAPSVVPSGTSSTLTVATSPTTPAGTYPLAVKGVKNGVAHTATLTLVVAADLPPTAFFVSSCEGRTCTLNGFGSHDDIGISSWTWDFGDGSPVVTTGGVVQHVYAANNGYRVQLTVTDTHGQTGTYAAGVTAVDRPPTAKFSLACKGLKCSVSAAQSMDDVQIVSYAWTFGDGTAQSGPRLISLSHSYATYGHYTITLTVTDSVGQRAMTGLPVVLMQPASANILPMCNGMGCIFDASASFLPTGIVAYIWDFGDGTTANLPNPTVNHVYAVANTYVVQLSVVSATGFSLGTSATVTVPTGPTR